MRERTSEMLQSVVMTGPGEVSKSRWLKSVKDKTTGNEEVQEPRGQFLSGC